MLIISLLWGGISEKPGGLIDDRITNHIKSLAEGPNFITIIFQAFDVNNGFRFKAIEYEKNAQNSNLIVVQRLKAMLILVIQG